MFMADHSKPDLYVLGTEGTPYRGRIIQLRHVQTCLRLSCLSLSFLDAASRSLLPAPERNETLVVLVRCAPPCEIRGQPRTLKLNAG